MKFYYCFHTTYHNGTRIGGNHGRCLLDAEPMNEDINITWENLDEMYQKLGVGCAFNIWNFKKGRLVSFFSDRMFPTGDYADVKEWKKPLNVTIKVTYKEYSPSISEVLKWHDGEKALAYLRERGWEK